jgi:hypothetical protein
MYPHVYPLITYVLGHDSVCMVVLLVLLHTHIYDTWYLGATGYVGICPQGYTHNTYTVVSGS